MAAEDVQPEKGMSLFLDIFRRADKNDDGALSWDEFKTYFADGVVSKDELEKLFHEIDTHDTNNIDTGELLTYFKEHLGPFREVLCAIEDLNAAVASTLKNTSETYSGAGFSGQFLTRFLLRETIAQLGAIQYPLDIASDHIDAESHADRTTEEIKTGAEEAGVPQVEKDVHGTFPLAVEDGISPPGKIIPGRYGRRYRKQLSTQTSWTTERGMSNTANLNQQVDRLRSLLDRFENRVNLDGGPEEKINIKDEELLFVVRRRMRVVESEEKSFKSSLRSYVESVNEDKACQHLSVRTYDGSNCYIVYEVWKSDDEWKTHMRSPAYKAFQHANVDCLEMPEQVSSILIPSDWWSKE